MNRSMKPGVKIFIIALMMIGAFALYLKFWDDVVSIVAPSGRQNGSILVDEKNETKTAETKTVANTDDSMPVKTDMAPIPHNDIPIVKIGVVTWGGYAAGQYWNNGFKASKSSRFFRDYGFMVEFIVLDDFLKSREVWKAGGVQLLWATVDAFPTEAGLKEYDPRFIFQADWSRGGDVIVTTLGINSMHDLRGKKISVALGTPSHTFLLLMLQAADMEYSEVEIIGVDNATIAASHFKSGKVDAAVVWSPDDADCLKSVPGSHALKTTREVPYIIADGFFAKGSFIDANPEIINGLYEGWMKGAAEINSNPEAKEKAIQILIDGLNSPEAYVRKAIENVRIATHGDNMNFFGLNPAYRGVTGQELYEKMAKLYNAINMAPDIIPAWRSVNDTKAVRKADALFKNDPNSVSEGGFVFKEATPQEVVSQAITSKTLYVTFAIGSAVLDQNAKVLIDMTFSDTVRQFANSRMRVVGHTDDTGNPQANQKLSERRAQSMVDYLTEKYGLDKKMFIVIGKGQNEPVASNTTEDGRAQNRRTELQVL